MIGFLTEQIVMFLSTPLTLILVLLEIFISVRYDKHYYSVSDTKSNLFLGFCYILTDLISRGAGLVLLTAFYFYGLHLAPVAHPVVYWVSLVLLEDLSYWFMHYMDHRIRILWAGHIHHHSSKEFNFSVGLRSAVFEPIEKFFFFIPLALIGYHPIDIVLIYILSQGWGTFVHTKTIKKLGLLEYVFTTPSHHRVHHGMNAKYLDKNYGMFLIIWDKLFGTFQPEDPDEPVVYGTVKDVNYKNYLDVIFNEYGQIIKDTKQPIPFKEKMRYIFGPPGYKHKQELKRGQHLNHTTENKQLQNIQSPL
jgi:sterol desaturase/sphingolipid hydroxylase (fatty acid hydroxylase superfamily)